MMLWPQRRCANCAFLGQSVHPNHAVTPRDDVVMCRRNPLCSMSITMSKAAADIHVCGEHRTEAEVNADIRARALAAFQVEKDGAIANNCLATWAQAKGAV